MIAYPRIYLYKRIVEAKCYIDNNFMESISLATIAHQASFSKFHFSRLFKEYYGTTPHQYLTALRIKEAKKLLKKGVQTVEVCHAVGFESVSSFIRLFKKHACLTPTEFTAISTHSLLSIKQDPLSFIPVSYAEYLGWKAK